MNNKQARNKPEKEGKNFIKKILMSAYCKVRNYQTESKWVTCFLKSIPLIFLDRNLLPVPTEKVATADELQTMFEEKIIYRTGDEQLYQGNKNGNLGAFPFFCFHA
jgi:hypothetical protein